jgi:hypothetical protein
MRKRKTMTVSQDKDLKPFMNRMVTLIPMLLISAEFAKVAIIDIKRLNNAVHRLRLQLHNRRRKTKVRNSFLPRL